MSQLNISQTELSELIHDVYLAPINNDWKTVFDKLADHTCSNKVFWFFADLKEQKLIASEFSMKMEASAAIIEDFFSRPFDDPYYHVAKNLVEGEAQFLNEQFDLDQHKGEDFYETILKPMDSGQAIAGVLSRDPDFEALFAINRGFEDLVYSQQDMALVELITPHLNRAMHIYKSLQLYKGQAQLNKALLDNAQKGIVVCDAKGRIVLANAFIERIFTDSSLILERDGHLTLAEAELNEQLRITIENSAGIADLTINNLQTLLVSDELSEYLIDVSPLSASGELAKEVKQKCLITIKQQSAMPWEVIQKEFGLTGQELAVVKRVYSKVKLSGIADELGLAYQTIRNHLQSVYRKAAVNSQTELMVKLGMFAE